MSREFSPHEAHIPYLLQFFAEFNLAGMALLRISHAAFRAPVPATRSFLWNNKELLDDQVRF
jgi:DNA polymerase zeta